MNIKEYLSNKGNYGNKRNMNNVKYLVIHYTGNDGDTALNNCKYFRDNVVKASAHYFVDDNSIYRSVPDDSNAYSVGTKSGYRHKYCRNSNSLSIEICDTRRNGTYDFTTKTIANDIILFGISLSVSNAKANKFVKAFSSYVVFFISSKISA